MERTQQDAADGSATYDLDFTNIETGRLLILETGPDDSLPEEETIALRIRDAGAQVAVVGRVIVSAVVTPCRATLSVLSSHSESHAGSLRLTVSLLDFRRGLYELLGSDEVSAGQDRFSQFTTRLQAEDARIGEDGEIRVRLTVSPSGPASQSEGYVYAISEVTLTLQPDGDRSALATTDLSQAVVLTEAPNLASLSGPQERQRYGDDNHYASDDL